MTDAAYVNTFADKDMHDVLKDCLRSKAHGLSVESIASQIGMGSSDCLYKSYMKDSGNYFPLVRLPALIAATEDLSLLYHLLAQRNVQKVIEEKGDKGWLKFICQKMGYLPVKLTGRAKAGKDLKDLPVRFAVVHRSLTIAFESQEISEEEYQEACELLAEMAGLVRHAEKIRSKQLELDLGRD